MPNALEEFARRRAGRSDVPLRVLTPAELLALPARDYLLKGIMSRGEMSIWWGPPKTGKSFFVMHVAYALSQGRSVFGRRVKAARVVYLACEGRSGLRGRIEALAATYGLSPDFLAVAQPVDLWAEGITTDALIAIIRREHVGLLVADTLNRVFGAREENASADMGIVIANLDRIRAETGVHIAIIHHGSKSGIGGPRGHGSLTGAADALIEIANEGGARTAVLTDAKDDASGQPMPFTLRIVELGQDADGDARTTCLVDEGDVAQPGKPRRLPASQRVALQLLERAILDTSDKPPASRHVPDNVPIAAFSMWRAYCYAGQITEADNPDARQKAFRRSAKALQENGFIGCWQDWVWLTDKRT